VSGLRSEQACPPLPHPIGTTQNLPTHTYTNAAAVVAEESANIPCNSTRVIISKNGLCVGWREGVSK